MLLNHYNFLVAIALSALTTGCVSNQSSDKLTTTPSNQSTYSNFTKAPLNIAVLVGVNQYHTGIRQDQSLPPLSFARQDASLLASVFLNQGYQVTTLTDFEVDKQHLLATLTALKKDNAHTESTIVFAFSGHGFQHDGLNYLAFGNTDLTRIESTALSIKELKHVISQLGFQNQVILIDACRNTPVKNTSNLTLNFTEDGTSEGNAIMYSTAAGALSYEDPKIGQGQGVFSYYVAEGIRSMAQSGKQVTFSSLFNYVGQRVQHHVASTYGRQQVPYIAGERSGDPVLVSQQAASAGQRAAMHQSTRSVWHRVLIAIAVAAVGSLVANTADSNGSEPSDNVTLIVPTP